MFLKLSNPITQDQVSNNDKKSYCDNLQDINAKWNVNIDVFVEQTKILDDIVSYFDNLIKSQLKIQKEKLETVDVQIDKYNKNLDERIMQSMFTTDDKTIINDNKINDILSTLNKKYNILKDIPYKQSETELLETIKLLKNMIGDIESIDENSNSIDVLLKTYVKVISTFTTSSAMIKLTSLGLDELRDVILRNDIQLWYKINDELKVMLKQETFNVIQMFLYIEITKLVESNASEIATFKTNYLNNISNDIKNDTVNFLSVVNGDPTANYLYIKRFSTIVKSLLDDTNTGFVIYIKNVIANYIIDNIHLFIGFYKIYKFIESDINDQFQVQLNEILKNKVKNNVLTYVKIRNDDGPVYNNRFKVYYNINQTRVDSQDKTLMVVKYNDHNIPYFENVNKKWKPSNTLEKDFSKISKEPFNNYFKVLTNDLEVLKYDHTYMLGPFTNIFPQSLKNNEIALNTPDIINSLISKKPVFVIGYGASGSGKTSSLIYFNKGSDENQKNGILMHIANIMGQKHGYTKLSIKSFEFLRKRDSQETTIFTSPNTKNNNINTIDFTFNGNNFELDNNYTHVNHFIDRTGSDITEFTQGTTIGKIIIHLVDTDRFVKATTNNPNSSRSHTIIFIKFKNENGEETTLILGDFAGVENLFNCKDDEVIIKFLNVKKDDGSGVRFYSQQNSIDGIQESQLGGKSDDLEYMQEVLKTAQKLGDTAYIERLTTQIEKIKNQQMQNTVSEPTVTVSEPTVTVSEPTVSEPEPTVSEVSVPTVTVSEPTVSEVSEPTVSEPTVSEPTVSEPTVSEPTVTVSEPSVSEVSEPTESVSEPTEITEPITAPEIEKDLINIEGMQMNKDCDNYIIKNEDLYIFDKDSKIRLKNGDDINKQIRNNRFYEQSGNYYEMQKNILISISEKYFPDDENKKRATKENIFDFVKLLYNKGVDVFSEHSKQNLDKDTIMADNILIFLNLNKPKVNSDIEIGKLKVKFFNYVMQIMDYSYLNDIDIIYPKGSLLRDISDSKDGVTKIKSVQDELKNNRDAWGSNPYEEMNKMKPVLKKYFETRKKLAEEFIKGEVTNLTDKLLFDYSLNLKIKCKRGLPKCQKLIKSKMENMSEFISRWKDLFSNHIFKTIKIKVDNDKTIFEDTWNSLLDFYSKPGQAEDFMFRLRDIDNYIYNELKDIIQETSCRLNYGRKVCEVRRNEGVMINNSLNDIRETIKKILIEKNKSSINISPTFIEACLSNYCINDNCFPIVTDNKDINSEIFDKIKEELGENFNFKDIIVSVFCVLNLSRSANNPPPVPYIDINNIWYEINHTRTKDLFNKNSRFFKESFNLIKNMKTFEDKIKEILQSDAYINFNEIISKIKNNESVKILSEEDESDKKKVVIFLEEIDKINAATAIGTLQYVDTISKFNTTQMICSIDNIKEYNQFINKYNFVDIVKGTKMIDKK